MCNISKNINKAGVLSGTEEKKKKEKLNETDAQTA